MTGFLGEYEVSLDAKGRFLIPAGFRKQMTDDTQAGRFVMNRGFEPCLTLYTMEVWDKISERLSGLNDFNPKAREFKRLFLNGANLIEADSAGRLNIPKPLMDYAGMSKDVIFSAQGNKVELWDKNAYQQYMYKTSAAYSSLAAEVAGADFSIDF